MEFSSRKLLALLLEYLCTLYISGLGGKLLLSWRHLWFLPGSPSTFNKLSSKDNGCSYMDQWAFTFGTLKLIILYLIGGPLLVFLHCTNDSSTWDSHCQSLHGAQTVTFLICTAYWYLVYYLQKAVIYTLLD